MSHRRPAPKSWPKSGGRFNRDRPLVSEARERIRANAAQFLEELGHRIAGKARKLAKAAGDEGKDDPAVATAETDYGPLRDAIEPELKVIAKDGAALGLDQVGADLDALLSQANKRAVSWAEVRAGEVITSVSETTRGRVRELVTQAEEEGWSNDELADAISGDAVFDDARAELIARTESHAADVAGNLIGWKESGVVTGKQWIVAQDSVCDECADMDGVTVDLDEEFELGDPPAHPACRCDCLPVLSEDAE